MREWREVDAQSHGFRSAAAIPNCTPLVRPCWGVRLFRFLFNYSPIRYDR